MNIKYGTETEQIANVNKFLDAGHGRGALISRATVYDGKVGYFCVHPVTVEGVKQTCILFACSPHEDIIITDFSPSSGALE